MPGLTMKCKRSGMLALPFLAATARPALCFKYMLLLIWPVLAFAGFYRTLFDDTYGGALKPHPPHGNPPLPRRVEAPPSPWGPTSS